MNLLHARSVVFKEQMNWNRPHLRWLPKSLYRYFREARK